MQIDFKEKINFMIIKNNKKHILLWLYGLSGSGKSVISKKITPFIKKNTLQNANLLIQKIKNVQ